LGKGNFLCFSNSHFRTLIGFGKCNEYPSSVWHFQRRQIVTGEYEPTDDECEFPLEEDEYCSMKYYKIMMAKKKKEAEANKLVFPSLLGINGLYSNSKLINPQLFVLFYKALLSMIK